MASTTGGGGKMGGGARRRTQASAAWLGAVVAAAVLARLTGRGPFAWLETWYAVTTGSLLGANILFAILILALPAILVLMGAAERAEKGARTTAERRRHLRWVVGSLYGLAGLSLLVAVVAGLFVARAPDGSEPALAVSAEQLGRGAAPAGRRIAIKGASDRDLRATFTQAQKNGSTTWVYQGFRPGTTRTQVDAGALDGQPVVLFLEGAYRGAEGNYQRPLQETVEGFLVENGLPPYARIALERQGVRIATPHYLLRSGEGGLAGDYYVPLGLGIFFAFVFGVIGTIVLAVQAMQSARH